MSDQTPNPQENATKNISQATQATTQVAVQAAVEVAKKAVKKTAEGAADLAVTAATAGTSKLVQIGGKILKAAPKIIERIQRLGSLTTRLPKGQKSNALATAIGVIVLFLFFFMEMVTKAEPFLSSLTQAPSTPGDHTIENGDLLAIFRQAAKEACVPLPLLIAISKQEAGKIWTYSPEEVKKFSEPNWWENATSKELRKGYCYDTCSEWPSPCATVNCTTRENSGSRETTVYGPMQFEECTWSHLMSEYKSKDRCRLDLAVAAAGRKLHRDAETDKCTGWNNETLLLAIKRYCGSCNSSSCPNYCNLVMAWYNEVITKYPNE